jgi:hypothetical protein
MFHALLRYVGVWLMVIATCCYLVLDLSFRPFCAPVTQRLSSLAASSLLILSVCALILSGRFREDTVVVANTDYSPVLVIQVFCIFAPLLYLFVDTLSTNRLRIAELTCLLGSFLLKVLLIVARGACAILSCCGNFSRGFCFTVANFVRREESCGSTRACSHPEQEASLQQRLVPA